MIVAISQPEHFPYLGYFQKMEACDCFVLLDCVKFQGTGSFQTRNWFTNTQHHKEWFTVPVPKGSSQLLLKDVRVAPGMTWRKRIVRKLRYNLGRDLSEIYLASSPFLAHINALSVVYCAQRLNISTPVVRSSELSGIHGEKSERVANICKALGASVYLSGPGARGYLDKRAFSNITLEFFTPNVPDHQSALAHLPS